VRNGGGTSLVRFGEPQWLRVELAQKYGQDAPRADEPLHADTALKRICDLSGLSIVPAALSAPEPFTISDISMDAHVKELDVSLLARADELLLEAKSKHKSRERALALVVEVVSILKRELAADPENLAILHRLAKLHLLRMKRMIETSAHWSPSYISDALQSTLRALASSKNDSALLRCKFALLELKQAVELLDVVGAGPHFVTAMEQAQLLDERGSWIFPRDAAAARRRISKLQTRLRDGFVSLIEGICFASDYDVVLKLAAQFPQLAELIAKALVKMPREDWRLPKFLWLALCLADQSTTAEEAARDWLACSSHVELEALTHCAVTDAVAARVLRHAGEVESATFCHSIITDATLMESGRFPQSLRRLVLQGCNLVTSDGLIALFKAHAALEQLEAEDCSSLIGDALWSNLGPMLQVLKLNRCPRVSTPATAVSFPAGLQTLEVQDCPLIELSVEFVASLPASLVHFAADNLGAAQAAHLPRNLERLWLSSQLMGGEIDLPRLRSVCLGRHMNDDGLLLLCSRSPELVELDVSHCLQLLDAQKISTSLQRLSRLESLNVGSNLPMSNDSVVVPLLASGARLHSIDCSGAW
jgi:hypothetical protein